jgi:glycosyltransferase involved in cell wall biosynthesis
MHLLRTVAEKTRCRFVFMTSNLAWGGSEELWSVAAAALAADGHTVTAYIGNIDSIEPRIRELQKLSCKIYQLSRKTQAIFRRLARLLRFLVPRSAHARLVKLFALVGEFGNMSLVLSMVDRPDIAVISQGINHEGMALAGICRLFKVPYVLVAHKASHLYWPEDAELPLLRQTFEGAQWCYFVCRHNHGLTEEQLGIDLPRASVIRNPFLVPWERRNDWPDTDRGLQLACVGRLCPPEKGQDLLLRVLARGKWRARQMTVTFYGTGEQEQALKGLATRLKLESVIFAGFVRDIASIWGRHHGLILPSRCEGLPLTLVEAMLCARVPIVTDVGGNSEVIIDGQNGFLAAAPTEDCLDEAMERAWQQREHWQAIGNAAADHIRTLVPPNPGRVFASSLLQIALQTENSE